MSRVTITDPRHFLFGHRLAVLDERSGRGPSYVVVELADGRKRSVRIAATDLVPPGNSSSAAEPSRLAASVPGVGALAASEILASAPDPQAFKSGRDFAAWLGATPKQNSTGGKEKFGSITKQGNRYIRRLLVLGAISVLRAAPKRKGALCDWLAALRARKPAKVVAVALANKLARIVWTIITTGEAFRSSIYAKA